MEFPLQQTQLTQTHKLKTNKKNKTKTKNNIKTNKKITPFIHLGSYEQI
jgi:hypothetical protein